MLRRAIASLCTFAAVFERLDANFANDDRHPIVVAARDYFREQVTSTFHDAVSFVVGESDRQGRSLDRELPVEQRTLTPADHGFHNSLRTADSKLIFLDFEYAGWDDPAQMIANACLQPEVPVPESLRKALLQELIQSLGGGDELVQRTSLVYPLLALKWALIMLNEFLPVQRDRREFAQVS